MVAAGDATCGALRSCFEDDDRRANMDARSLRETCPPNRRRPKHFASASWHSSALSAASEASVPAAPPKLEHENPGLELFEALLVSLEGGKDAPSSKPNVIGTAC
jgi:hypothetical protein